MAGSFDELAKTHDFIVITRKHGDVSEIECDMHGDPCNLIRMLTSAQEKLVVGLSDEVVRQKAKN